MTVTIPTKSEHGGCSLYLTTIEISDFCPKCNAKRGVKRWKGYSYDGSKRLVVDCWENECKHLDLYKEVLKEAYAK